MKYAFVNGILLDGTKDMAPAAGKTVLVENGKIKDILDGSEVPAGYETVDLSGA
ncbi:MAG: hypothetical protein K6D92_02300 [Erysipelotrichaceae bacterium]|nr:hypothetical protein [Erysipelotrichaceae bacterium]